MNKTKKITIKFNQKEINLLYEILCHCDEHCDWMKETLDNGELFHDILGEVQEVVNYD